MWQGGKCVGTRRVYDNRLLMRILERFDRSWAPRSHQTVEGKVEHRHAGAFLTLSADDVMRLEPDEQRAIVELVEKIGLLKDGRENQKLLG